jgi:hypothetical protein
MHERGSWRGERWIVFAGFVCLIGEAIGTYTFTPLLKPIVADLGWTRTQFTLSLACRACCSSICSPW